MVRPVLLHCTRNTRRQDGSPCWLRSQRTRAALQSHALPTTQHSPAVFSHTCSPGKLETIQWVAQPGPEGKLWYNMRDAAAPPPNYYRLFLYTTAEEGARQGLSSEPHLPTSTKMSTVPSKAAQPHTHGLLVLQHTSTAVAATLALHHYTNTRSFRQDGNANGVVSTASRRSTKSSQWQEQRFSLCFLAVVEVAWWLPMRRRWGHDGCPSSQMRGWKEWRSQGREGRAKWWDLQRWHWQVPMWGRRVGQPPYVGRHHGRQGATLSTW